MVVEILGVVNVFPVPNEVPPVGTPYQFIIPEEATAPRVTIPASQREFGVVVVMVGEVFTVAIIGVLAFVVHPFAVAST